jgi:hypothetical protein
LGFFVDLFFFRCNQVSVAFGFMFGTYIYSEFGGVGFDTFLFGYFGCPFGLVLFYVIIWFHFRILSFFSVSPLGLLGFFGLVIFLGIWYRGLVFCSEFGCVPLHIY